MTWTVLLQISVLLASVGAGGGIFTAFIGRSKVHADTTAILTGISSKQIEQLQADLDRTLTKLHLMERALFAHQRWSIMVLRQLETLGAKDIPEPPDIFL